MNKPASNKSSARRQRAYVSVIGTTLLNLRSPYVIAWWSAAFPGLGHILLAKHLRGFLLFIWEVLLNIKSHLNLAIFYSFTGRFDMAKEVIDINWVLLYVPTYIFTIWDSYRTTIDINNNYILAAREDAEIKPFSINGIELDYLDKRTPWSAAVWSLLMPGTGQLYYCRVIDSAFIFAWFIVIAYYSKLLPAIHYTLLGNFDQAKLVTNPQWLINAPSVYMFAMYDAYVNTVEKNKLFDWEQSKFFKKDYQNKYFNMPSKRRGNGGDNMNIVSTFEHSINIEKAITAIQMKGIAKEDILVVPMDKRDEERTLFDSIHQSDGLSLIDFPAILGTIFMILGTIYGFILEWGPILWGLIGLFTGFGIGFAVKLHTTKKYKDRQKNKKAPEVVLIIECKENQLEMVKDTLWAHYALGVTKLDLGSISNRH